MCFYLWPQDGGAGSLAGWNNNFAQLSLVVPSYTLCSDNISIVVGTVKF